MIMIINIMIIGKCHTNLDDYKFKDWPTKFVAVPEVGQKIESTSGHRLYVSDVTHCVCTSKMDANVELGDPYIKVDLCEHHPLRTSY